MRVRYADFIDEGVVFACVFRLLVKFTKPWRYNGWIHAAYREPLSTRNDDITLAYRGSRPLLVVFSCGFMLDVLGGDRGPGAGPWLVVYWCRRVMSMPCFVHVC